MKAILKENYRVNSLLESLLELQKGETVIIIREYYGCGCSNSYKCIVPDGTQQFIPDNILEIVDYTPTIDWEQIKIQAAIAAMQGVCANLSHHLDVDTIAKRSIQQADALIEELKKRK